MCLAFSEGQCCLSLQTECKTMQKYAKLHRTMQKYIKTMQNYANVRKSHANMYRNSWQTLKTQQIKNTVDRTLERGRRTFQLNDRSIKKYLADFRRISQDFIDVHGISRMFSDFRSFFSDFPSFSWIFIFSRIFMDFRGFSSNFTDVLIFS